MRLAALLSGRARLRGPVGARAAATERRRIAFRGGARLTGLDRRAQASLGLVIATVGFLPGSRRTCAMSVVNTGRATNDPPWPQGLLPSKCTGPAMRL
jgi:hypothetical protein